MRRIASELGASQALSRAGPNQRILARLFGGPNRLSPAASILHYDTRGVAYRPPVVQNYRGVRTRRAWPISSLGSCTGDERRDLVRLPAVPVVPNLQ